MPLRAGPVLPGRLPPAPGDTTRGLQFAHVVAHRDGGGREAADLFHGCHDHHVAYDAGWLRVEMVDGRPVFHFGGGDGDGAWKGRRPAPPHLRPNPLAGRVRGWTWSRPPPE